MARCQLSLGLCFPLGNARGRAPELPVFSGAVWGLIVDMKEGIGVKVHGEGHWVCLGQGWCRLGRQAAAGLCSPLSGTGQERRTGSQERTDSSHMALLAT